MQQAVQDDIVRSVFRIQLVQEAPPPPQFGRPIPLPESMPQTPATANLAPPRMVTTNLGPLPGDGSDNGRRADGAPADWKGGRNDPCWCGSGQKYKKCHGKS